MALENFLKKQSSKQQATQAPAENSYSDYSGMFIDETADGVDAIPEEDLYGDSFGSSAPAPSVRAKGATTASSAVTKVRIMKPKEYEDARKIASKLIEGYIVSMNLECVESKEEIKNIMTFLAGVVFAIRAEIVSVSDQVWLLYPKNLVQLSEEGKDDN